MGKHLLRIQNVSERNQKHFCVSDITLLRARANRETFVSETLCPRLPPTLKSIMFVKKRPGRNIYEFTLTQSIK